MDEVATSAEPLWVLLGSRHGDNQQLLAIAESLGVRYRIVTLRFNAAAGLPPLLLGASRLSWRSDPPLAPPWPRAVLAAGRKTVPAARWIRRRSGGRTRLIHVNRPWAPLAWFDLVVGTPQYGLPARPNVVVNLLPFLTPAVDTALPDSLRSSAAALPRPWTVVLVGGDSRPLVLDDASAAGLASLVEAQVRTHGGSAWVVASPRTPVSAMDVIERGLDVPAHVVVRWGAAENPYRALLGSADRFVVTSDSASMLAEALASGRPVTPFALTVRPDWRWRLVAAWRAAAERAPSSPTGRCYAALLDLGLLSSVRDASRLLRELEAAGAFTASGVALARVERERAVTRDRIAALIDGG